MMALPKIAIQKLDQTKLTPRKCYRERTEMTWEFLPLVKKTQANLVHSALEPNRNLASFFILLFLEGNPRTLRIRDLVKAGGTGSLG